MFVFWRVENTVDLEHKAVVVQSESGKEGVGEVSPCAGAWQSCAGPSFGESVG